ncbi:hypothetical protein E2C01_033006 [Portunus trituberculatus]|uniref:Uncharacterized protein n=1 Tax=Portunus trituberculatus TaxID=210409 RepID=A0A5B7F2L5_PORTR|nr:hypothetical protein [Portunus trituberculatus]
MCVCVSLQGQHHPNQGQDEPPRPLQLGSITWPRCALLSPSPPTRTPNAQPATQPANLRPVPTSAPRHSLPLTLQRRITQAITALGRDALTQPNTDASCQ